MTYHYHLVIWLVIAAGSFVAGVRVESNHRDAQQLVSERAAHEAFKLRVAQDREINGKLSAGLSKERDGRAADATKYRRKIHAINNQSLVSCGKPAAGDQGSGQGAGAAGPARDPDVFFTPAFVGLWDDALAIGATEGERAGRADGSSPWASVAQPKDLLFNVAENAERFAECRTTVRGWQQWACENGHAAKAHCGG